MYNKIYDFCKTKNLGNATHNGLTEQPPRVKFLINIIETLGIDYTIKKFKKDPQDNFYLYNIYMKGSNNKMFIAHHDIVNSSFDNANDNSASCINCIMLKKLKPENNVCLLDGEEPPLFGAGSTELSNDIHNGEFGNISYVINLELTGKGGTNLVIGKNNSNIYRILMNKFNSAWTATFPFSDTEILIRNGIESACLMTVPLLEDGQPDYNLVYNCHSIEDSLDTIDPNDMKDFVEEILINI
jgi:hypothetical protein